MTTNECVQNVKVVEQTIPLHDGVRTQISQTVQRPWGTYTVLEEQSHYKVKRLVINPEASISLQYHNCRSEHWGVVKGIAHATKGTEHLVLQQNESTYVPQGTLHRLSNPGPDPLEIIEIQTGTYVGEDDIVRIGETDPEEA